MHGFVHLTYILLLLCFLHLPTASLGQEIVSPELPSPEKGSHPQEEEAEPLGVRISHLYRDGTYLIYDCYMNHWACVDKESSESCDERRKKAKERRQANLDCATFRPYADRKSCTDELTKNLHSARELEKIFCSYEKMFPSFIHSGQ